MSTHTHTVWMSKISRSPHGAQSHFLSIVTLAAAPLVRWLAPNYVLMATCLLDKWAQLDKFVDHSMASANNIIFTSSMTWNCVHLWTWFWIIDTLLHSVCVYVCALHKIAMTTMNYAITISHNHSISTHVIVLCCAVLCCAVLCCVVLCCAVLWCAFCSIGVSAKWTVWVVK